MGRIIHSTRRVGGILVEHIGALMLVGMAVGSIVMVGSLHTEIVHPAQERALAARVAFDLVQLHTTKQQQTLVEQEGSQHFAATIKENAVEVTANGERWSWHY